MIDIEKLEELEQAATPGPWDCYQPSELPEDIRIARGIPIGTVDSYRAYLGRVTQSHDPKQSGAAWGAHLPPRMEDVKVMVAARNALPELLAEIERLRKVGSEMVNAIEQWANGEAGWSTRLRAAQEAARPVLGMGLACRKPTEAFDAERRVRG